MNVREAEKVIEAAGVSVRYLDRKMANRLRAAAVGGGTRLPGLREVLWALVRDPAFRAFVLRLVAMAREEWERYRNSRRGRDEEANG